MGLAVSDILESSESLPQSLRDRIVEADVNKDGILSVQEFVQVVLSEQQAVAERRLFRRILLVMGVGGLLLIAALVGCVYGIVDLTRQIDDNDNILTSRASKEPMATGTVVSMNSNLSSLTDESSALQSALAMAQVVLPESDGGFVVHQVSSVRFSPLNGTTITTMSGESLGVNPDGTVSRDVQNETESGRRLLGAQKLPGYGISNEVSVILGYDKNPYARWRLFGGEQCGGKHTLTVCYIPNPTKEDYNCAPSDSKCNNDANNELEMGWPKSISVAVCRDGLPPSDGGNICGTNCEVSVFSFGTRCESCHPDKGFFEYDDVNKNLRKGVPKSVAEKMAKEHSIWATRLAECESKGDRAVYF